MSVKRQGRRRSASDRRADHRRCLKDIGTRLRAIESVFPNRARAAAAAGVAKSTFQSWVTGERDPSFIALARLCAATGFSLDWLATGEGPMRRTDGAARKQMDYWRERLTTALLEYRAAIAKAGVRPLPAETAMLIRDQLAFGEIDRDELVTTLRLIARFPAEDNTAQTPPAPSLEPALPTTTGSTNEAASPATSDQPSAATRGDGIASGHPPSSDNANDP